MRLTSGPAGDSANGFNPSLWRFRQETKRPVQQGSGTMKTVADQFAETLAAAGVKRVYGIVGDSPNRLTDALRRQGKIEWVHVRHEGGRRFRGRCRGASDG